MIYLKSNLITLDFPGKLFSSEQEKHVASMPLRFPGTGAKLDNPSYCLLSDNPPFIIHSEKIIQMQIIA